MEGDLCGIGDVAEKCVIEISAGGGKDGRRQKSAEPPALPVDVRIVGTREVDAFENAAPARRGIETVEDPHLSVTSDDNRFARRKFHNFRRRAVEGRLYGGPFACRDENLVVEIKVAGPYRM